MTQVAHKLTSRFRPKGIPIEDILELKDRNPDMTHEEMAAILKCDRTNITRRLAEHDPDVKALGRFQKHEGKVLATIRKKVTDSLQDLTPTELKKASPRDRALMYAILYDKGRLEEGKSTSNVSIADAAGRLADSIGGLQDELKALEDSE